MIGGSWGVILSIECSRRETACLTTDWEAWNQFSFFSKPHASYPHCQQEPESSHSSFEKEKKLSKLLLNVFQQSQCGGKIWKAINLLLDRLTLKKQIGCTLTLCFTAYHIKAVSPCTSAKVLATLVQKSLQRCKSWKPLRAIVLHQHQLAPLWLEIIFLISSNFPLPEESQAPAGLFSARMPPQKG